MPEAWSLVDHSASASGFQAFSGAGLHYHGRLFPEKRGSFCIYFGNGLSPSYQPEPYGFISKENKTKRKNLFLTDEKSSEKSFLALFSQ